MEDHYYNGLQDGIAAGKHAAAVEDGKLKADWEAECERRYQEGYRDAEQDFSRKSAEVSTNIGYMIEMFKSEIAALKKENNELRRANATTTRPVP